MSSILGPYYSPTHWRGEDERYIRELDPAWVNIHQPNARAIHQVQQAAPNAKIMLRCWDIDDHNGDRKREMYADPVGAAVRHLALWNEKLIALKNELRVNGWNYDETKWYLGLVNEPDPAFVPQVVTYSLEAMRIAAKNGWHLGVVASSVGTFAKPEENDRGWALCKPLEKPINDGGHILLVHEYWQPEGPNYGEDAGNLAWRHRSIPLNVPILIRESGANGYIYGRYSKDDDSGWQKTVKDEHGNPDPRRYAEQVREFIEGCDQRVVGVLLYMLDYHSSQWWSFDTQPAMNELLSIKDARPQRSSPAKDTTHLPGVFNSKPFPLFMRGDLVRTTTTVNARRTPGTQGKAADDVVAQLSPNTPVELLEGPQHADGLVWWRTAHGWVAEVAPNGLALLSNRPAQPAEPVIIPSGAINPHVAEAILDIESGNNAFASDGRLVIRFETHLFRRYLEDNALFDTYFYHDPQQGHLDQKWRRSPRDAWQPVHLDSNDFDANQRQEWEVFSFAAKLDRFAALSATSMGAPQIMGFNHKRIGYASPEAMYRAFQRSEVAQTIGFFNYCITDPDLFAAMRQGNWTEIARRYNGDSDQVPVYVQLMKDAYQRIIGG